jgi:predicted lipoprotein with Yx(FWY)xxD motif
MEEGLTREEERRGWRRAYLWAIGVALVLGLIVAVTPMLIGSLTTPEQSGMEQGASMPYEAPRGAVEPASIKVRSNPAFGEFLVDGAGHPLYLFKADRQGQGETPSEATCYGECAKAWPPLLTKGEPKASDGAKAELISVTNRRDGSQQVTYNGWPLYLYVKDVGPEDVTGQDVEDFGAEWYLVSPSGEPVQAEGPGAQG